MNTENQIEIKKIYGEYFKDSENESAGIGVTIEIEGIEQELSFNVQLLCGEYLPQMHCQIHNENGDQSDEFSEIESLVFEKAGDDIIELAEKLARNYEEETYEYIDARFKCSINSQSLYIRVNKYDETATLVVFYDDHNANDYSIKYGEREIFDNKEEALEYLEQFRTDDYHDFRGLNNYLSSDKNF